MPVSLTYDANATQVGTLPSWTGLGWTLQTGGVITRTVIGNPDMDWNYYQWDWGPLANIFGGQNLLAGSNSDLILENDFMSHVAIGDVETQPDVYYFNLPGYSGSFVITRDWQVIWRDDTDWEIVIHKANVEFTAPPPSGAVQEVRYDITGFTLYDPMGIRYEFGYQAFISPPGNTEYTDFQSDLIVPSNPTPLQAQSPRRYRFNSAWYLKSIVSADQSEVLELENALVREIAGASVNSEPFSLPFNAESDDAYTFPAVLWPETSCCGATNTTSPGDGLGAGAAPAISNRQYLRSATLHIGNQVAEKIYFNASYPTADNDNYYGPRSSGIRLDTIRVQRRWQGSLENTIQFDFNYDFSTGRLALKSVQERSTMTADQKPPYEFSYHNDPLPPTHSNAIDYWGYYNGQHANSVLVPQLTIDDRIFNPGGANRRAYGPLAGTLTQIKYPTGGQTDFQYEGHRIKSELPHIGDQIGGFRIASIVDNPGSGGPAVRRTFQYLTTDGLSSGELLQRMDIYTTSVFSNIPNPDVGCMPPVDPCECESFFCISHTLFASGAGPYSYIQGSHIGYSRVVEIIGETGSNIGKNVFVFHNTPTSGELWETRNGKLLRMEIWEGEGGAPARLVREMDYVYTFNAGCPGGGCPQILAFSVLSSLNQSNERRLCHRADNGQFLWTPLNGTTSSYPSCTRAKIFPTKYYRHPYLIRTAWHRLNQVTTTDHFYAPGTPGTVNKTVSYTYGNNSITLPTEISFNNSDGAPFSTKVTYFSSGSIKAIPRRVEKRVGGVVAAGTDQELDSFGRPLQISEILRDETLLPRITIPGYNTAGRPTGATFMGELPETYTWINGLPIKRNKGNWQWSYDYDNRRLPVSFTDIDAQVSLYEYDGLMRLSKSRSRDDNIITTLTYAYGGPNSVTSTTAYSDAPTQTLSEEFDGLGRPIRVVHNGVVKKEQFYDGYGRMWKETYLPGNFSTYHFDDSPLNRIIKQIFPDGNAIQTQYGAQANCFKTTTIDEKGNESSVLTEIVGRTYKTIDALGGETTFEYAPHGEPESVAPPAGDPYQYEYDNRRRLTRKKVPGAKAQLFAYYDENNLLRYSIDANGNRIDHQYDTYLRETHTKHRLLPNWDPDANMSHGTPGDDVLVTRYGEEFTGLGPIYTGRVRETWAKMIQNSGLTPSQDFTEIKYTYDNYGRAITTTETFPLLPGTTSGSDIWGRIFDHADRLAFEERIHAGFTGLTTSAFHLYDNFGRELYYAFSAGSPQAAAVAHDLQRPRRDEIQKARLCRQPPTRPHQIRIQRARLAHPHQRRGAGALGHPLRHLSGACRQRSIPAGRRKSRSERIARTAVQRRRHRHRRSRSLP